MRLLRPTPDEFCALFGPETRTIWVCSPWISAEGVALLRRALGSCKRSLLWDFELWTRMSDPDREITDYPAVEELLAWLRSEAPDIRLGVWTAERLHAKVFWTEEGALIGSANLTGLGFGENLELAVRLEPGECLGAASIREALRQGMRPVTREQWMAFLAGPSRLTRPVSEHGPEGVRDSPGADSFQDLYEKLLSRRPYPGGLR